MWLDFLGQNPIAESLNTTALDNQPECVKIHISALFGTLKKTDGIHKLANLTRAICVGRVLGNHEVLYHQHSSAESSR